MHRRTLGVLALAAGVLAACTQHQNPAAGPSPNSVAFPVTVTAANGAVRILARPMRILSLSATATQMLYGMGAGPQVVAVDKYSTDPPYAPRTSFTGYETSAEDYIAVHPDLVILAFDTGRSVMAQLATLHVAGLLLPPAASMDDTYTQIVELGQATGHGKEAAAEATSIRQGLDQVAASVGDRAKGRTYYQELDNTLYTATSKTFIGALYGRLGMVNVSDPADHSGSGYPQLNAEYLIQADPQYVFLADTVCCQQTAETFAARPGFSVLTAVRSHHVFGLQDSLASQWGPRVVDFLRTVAGDVVSGTASASP